MNLTWSRVDILYQMSVCVSGFQSAFASLEEMDMHV